MVLIIVIFLSGILLGFFFRKSIHVNKLSGKISSILVFLLLFSLGFSVGKNEMIMSNIAFLGIQSLLITVFAIAGSIGLLYIYLKITRK
jgi:uncharacterized membrane protein YbjE (DUF340 family)